MKPSRTTAGVLMPALILAACAFDLAHVEQVPAILRTMTPATPAFVLEHDVAIGLPLGYRRVLRQGTTWRYHGTVDAGDVYTTRDQVLTVEASNIHEAYIVVSDGKLVGFYLPVERTFSPARDSPALPCKPFP